MENRPESRQRITTGYLPKPETLALLKVSGNPINGLGETVPRRASPFFWHPPEQHPFGELQSAARQSSRKCPGSAPAFIAAYNHPDLIPIANDRIQASADEHTAMATQFALGHEADAVGIAPMDPLYVFEGYEINEPWVIILALAHNYERLKHVPSDETNGIGAPMLANNTLVAREPPLHSPTGSVLAAITLAHGRVHRQALCC